MPMSQDFQDRLSLVLPEIIEHYGTPFHIYDKRGIIETGERVRQVPWLKEYYAVKANPNPAIIELMHMLGFGLDCSSIPELMLAREAGARGDEIMFTSNNTQSNEYAEALADGGCILNLDDASFVGKVPEPFPRMICFRHNPGDRRIGDKAIGNPPESKYGVPHEKFVDAYGQAKDRGAREFGVQTMLCSNQPDYRYVVETARMLFEVAVMISKELGIQFSFINIGGGMGIPYKPEDPPFLFEQMAKEIEELREEFKRDQGYVPQICMESGRFMTGPHGVLVLTVVNPMTKYRKFVGVDGCCISTMMRPAMYHPKGGWHQISVHGKSDPPYETVSVVGSACEDTDRFGWDRLLPEVEEGDTILVHDTGAHCRPMGSNYNGRLRPKELMLHEDGTVELIRRAETVEDHFATLQFEPNILIPK